MHVIFIPNISLKIIKLRLRPHLPGPSELSILLGSGQTIQFGANRDTSIRRAAYGVWQLNCQKPSVQIMRPGQCGRSWWRHQMETFSTLLALCAWKSAVTVEFPSQRPAHYNFTVMYFGGGISVPSTLVKILHGNLKFVSKGPISNESALVYVIACHCLAQRRPS